MPAFSDERPHDWEIYASVLVLFYFLWGGGDLLELYELCEEIDGMGAKLKRSPNLYGVRCGQTKEKES